MVELLGAFIGLSILGVLLVILILPTIIWIWLLIDCIKREEFKYGSKLIWVLLFLFTNMIGMILYYFLEKRSG